MKFNFKILIMLSFTLILITSCVDKIECTTIEEIPSSVTIKKSTPPIIGLNTDTDSLNFGVVSPTAKVERSINVQYSKEAKVSVKADGDLSKWVSINPANFQISGESEKVTFTINVPEDANEGVYTSRMLFCFQE